MFLVKGIIVALLYEIKTKDSVSISTYNQTK